MRRFHTLAVLGTFALGMAYLPAFATGNVLVPSDTDLSNSKNYLGLLPAEPEAGQEQESSGSQSSETPNASALPSLDPGDSPSIAMLPKLTAGGMSIKPPPSYASGPQVIKLPAAENESTSMNSDLPNSIDISLADKYKLGTNDTGMVKRTIGMEASDVPKHCKLTASGLLKTDISGGLYPFDLGLSAQKTLYYDGNPVELSFRIRALCDLVPLPPETRYVTQVGDRYDVFVSYANCQPPTPAQKNLVIQFNEGKSTCAYQ